MLKVGRYTQHDEARIIDFIRKVQRDAAPDEEVLSHSVLIKDDKDIVGMVSYETHGDMGIIRYFLYDARIAGTDIVVGMFFELYKRAHEEGVKKLIAQIPSREVGTLFEMLGFTEATGDLSDVIDTAKNDIEIMLIHLEGKSFE